MSTAAEVLVIGGGIIGSFVAFEAARRGVSVCLIERGRIGCAGATRASGGNIRIYHDEPRISDRALRSFATWTELESTLGPDARFIRTGCLCLEPHVRESVAREEVARLRDKGVELQVLTPDELKSSFSSLCFEDVSLGVYDRAAGYVDPLRVSEALAAATLSLGGRVIQNVEVRATVLDVRSGGWRVTTSLCDFAVERIVYAGGAAGLGLIGKAVESFALRTKGIRARHFGTGNGGEPLLSCGISDMTTGLYGRPLASGGALLGLPTTDWDVAADSSSPTEPDSVFDWTCQKRVPHSQFARCEGGRYGVDVYRSDGVGVVEHWEDGLIIATGWSGSGVKVAPSVAADVVESLARRLMPHRLTRLSATDGIQTCPR